jgi:hypothetical protein
MKNVLAPLFATIVLFAASAGAETPPALRVGRAGHAFDHVGAINAQAEAAAASGATILYATGLGSLGYTGLPAESAFAAERDALTKYNRDAKKLGIELSLGYLCATSIVKLDTFDKNWPDDFRARFKTPPAEWRQQDQNGQPLASWYGGDYNPACMNNPDWRVYEEFLVCQSLETGHDGIFFDNPTVHPQGCYCPHCMERFARFLEREGKATPVAEAKNAGKDATTALRQFAVAHPQEFLRFRSTTGRDFLEQMRRYARTIDRNALITCNNSLNSPDRMYAQCRMHGYNISEMSNAEDLVVVEDMVSQPRTEAGGGMFEYGSTYKQLHAISHGKPIVAVTLANGDYHTPPNLVRLAMAEAAANGASYLSWPTWPENQRQRMIDAVRPQADWLRENEALLNDAAFRADVVLFLPFRRWVDVEQCAASGLAATLSQANIQYRVISEDDFELSNAGPRTVLLVESLGVLTQQEKAIVEVYENKGGRVVTAEHSEWLKLLPEAIGTPSIGLQAPPTVRAVVRDQPNRTIVHLLNLHVERLSSFDDKVMSATDVGLKVRVPFAVVRDVTIHTADKGGSSGPLKFTVQSDGDGSMIEVKVPRLDISAILVIDD